jgi:hypothetical protein
MNDIASARLSPLEPIKDDRMLWVEGRERVYDFRWFGDLNLDNRIAALAQRGFGFTHGFQNFSSGAAAPDRFMLCQKNY